MYSRSAIETCVVGSRTCAEECEHYAAHHDHRRVCVEFVAGHEAEVRCARDGCGAALARPGRRPGVRETPTFFVNAERLDRPWRDLPQIVRESLATA
jgi:hypothetical protein